MAEGDKFERKLRGKGWAKAYRLAKGCAPMSMVVDALISASAHGLRPDNELYCPNISEIFNALNSALNAQWQRRQQRLSLVGSAPPYQTLSEKLESIEADSLGSISTRLAARAAEVVFGDLESKRQPVPTQDVLNHFAELFVSRLIDNRYLGVVRDGIVAGSERSPAAQAEWEHELFTTLAPQAHNLIKGMVKPDGSQAVARAPRRLTTRRKITKELLYQPLGGAR